MCSIHRKIHQHTVKSLVKDHPTAVYDSLLGNALTNKNLVVLENHCIIMRRDHRSMKGKVKIISGGGAGTEPAEAYYVGKGMLTAAVIGNIFTAPSANEILIAIKELAVDNTDGILLLVKNYVGDKLNFTLAMEQALSNYISVKMLVISDDVFHHFPARHGRKGAAGSVLVYKILGEMAEQGKMLEEIIKEYNENIVDELATANVTLTPCTNSTCSYFNHFIGLQEMVIGLGIYGKGGAKKIHITDLKDAVSVVLEEIISSLICNENKKEIVVLVNNLGGTTKLEEAVIAKEVSMQLNNLGFSIAQIYVGTFLTSLGSQGFSVSILKVNSQHIINSLQAATSAPGWPRTDLEDLIEFDPLTLPITATACCSYDSLNDGEVQNASTAPVLSEKAGAAMRQILTFAAEALISCEPQLNFIDMEAGDGDTGTSLKRAAEVLRTSVIDGEMDFRNPSKFLFELSDICCKHMGGLLGALYCVFFKSAAKTFQNSTEITPELCCTAFKDAIRALKCYGNAELGDRTMLDALGPAVDSFEAAIKHGKDLTKAVYLAATTCEFKSEETKCIRPSTIQHMDGQQTVMYPDAGAHAATIWLRAITFDDETSSHQPGIFLWKFMNQEETKYLIENELASQDLMFFFEKKIGSDEYLLTILLMETVKFCRGQWNEDHKKTSALVGTVYYTHEYFVSSRWRTPAEVYFYFRESILRQSVESPPMSMEIFQPEDAKDCVIFFSETYVRNLAVTSILHLPHYKLHLKLKGDKIIKDQSLFGK